MGVMHACNYPGCMKKFDRKYNLKCHLRIHSDEKPYRCHHHNCTRSFRWKSSLNHHLMSLDHTPPADRRARKARAARRRQAQKLHHQHSISTQTDPSYPVPDHQFLDLPAHSPVSSRTMSHTTPSPSPLSQSHPVHPPPAIPSHKLEQPLDLSDVSVSSIQDLPGSVSSTDLSFISSPQQQQHQLHQLHHHQHQQQLQLQQQLAHNPHLSHSHLSHLSHLSSLSHLSLPQPQPVMDSNLSTTLWPHLPNFPAIPTKLHPESMPSSHIIPHHTRVSFDESSVPRQLSALSAHQSPIHCHDDTLTNMLVKEEAHHIPTVFQNTAQMDMDSMFENLPITRHSSNSLVKQAVQPAQKHLAPLVSIFEELSPVSPINLPSALDSLFHSPNMDTNALKTF